MSGILDITDAIRQVGEHQDSPQVVVRVTTERWSDSRGVCECRRVRYLRRLCRGHNFLEEDVTMVGAQETLDSIVNWHEVPDGVYTVEMCNQSRDWETGHVEEWDYRLVSVDEEPTQTR